ncbi:MAG: hypothetical protein U0324_09585 [Polyangiales bacterium]
MTEPRPGDPDRRAYHAERARLAACRWLEPDASFEAMGDDARGWLDDRVEELRAALLPYVDTPEALDGLTARVERSAGAAVEAWAASWARGDVAPSALATALARAEAEVRAALHGRDPAPTWTYFGFGAASRTHGAVWRAMLDRHRRAEGGPGRILDETHPAQLACASHLRWLFAFGEVPSRRSPWAPLVALFERGAWPVALGDGSLLVYVPVLREGTVVPSPESPEVLLLPPRRPRPAPPTSVAPTLAALEAAGVAVPPMAPDVFEPAGLRGRIAAVGPRPAVAPRPRPPRRRARDDEGD